MQYDDVHPVNIQNPNPTPGREQTPRGFAIYGRRLDLYKEPMAVQESSLASQDAVWVFGTNLHLGVEEARWLRARLAEWLEDKGYPLEEETCKSEAPQAGATSSRPSPRSPATRAERL